MITYLNKIKSKVFIFCLLVNSLNLFAQETNAALCSNEKITFSFETSALNLNYVWSSIDSNSNVLEASISSTNPSFTFSFDRAGDYVIKMEAINAEGCKTMFSKAITINDCTVCDHCASFELMEGEKYLVSGWVKESDLTSIEDQRLNYDKSCIGISFTNIDGVPIETTRKFYPMGEIIDGWQRIIGEFIVPEKAGDVILDLLNENDTVDKTVYFDDIRILPSKGNMKSFVYDQYTHRLMAELDENNYATFYEYDLEGGLVRIKKETEKGVFTIQETRSGNTKTN